MTSWRDEYIAALKDRDEDEKADYELIDICRYSSAFLDKEANNG